MNLKWIFFDIGWSLVDETQAHRTRLLELQEWLRLININIELNELVAKCEEAATAFAISPFWRMLEGFGLSDEQIDSAKQSFAYAKANEYLYPGVPELLTDLQQKYELGVIANQSTGTEARLQQWGISDRFSLVFASAELGLSKPDPRIFSEALVAAKCTPDQVLMVGDRLDNDIGPANQKGWNTARVLQGFSRFQQPRTSFERPDITLGGIKELGLVV